MKRWIFITIWLGLIAYAATLAPPEQPDTLDLIRRMSTGDWARINPAVIAIFNAMGLWPMVYACVALIDGQGQKWPAWPFVLASFGVGAFAILPYLALRSPYPSATDLPSPLLRLLDSRWLGVLLMAAAIALAVFGWRYGDWPDFWQQWQTSRFIHVMTLDFCALWLLFPVLMQDDMTCRGLTQPWIVAGVLALPLVGACLYLTLRPSLPSSCIDIEGQKSLVAVRQIKS